MKEVEVRADLERAAARMRIHSIRATTAAGSGHPTSSLSAAEIVSVVLLSVMRYDPTDPTGPDNDTFILSKGHAAPILYAGLAEVGVLSVDELVNLRKIDSPLEGHPTPRVPSVKVATGSLGQGLSAGVGIALGAKRLDKSADRTYVLLGDGEIAEGAIWEAAAAASHYQLDNLCAIVDVNRLGQSESTSLGHDLKTLQERWQAFGWKALIAEGHDVEELLQCFEQAADTRASPTVVLARTIKGKGIPETEDRLGFHGKPVSAEEAEGVIQRLQQEAGPPRDRPATRSITHPTNARAASTAIGPAPSYQPGENKVATRQAFGAALAAAGGDNPDIVVLDGDVKNSTYTELFEEVHSDRFFQTFIAEQNMIGAAIGLATRRKIPFSASFACFLSRAHDFIRMAAISNSNIKLVGSHAGVSIGEDGPSQMGLEDLAMFCAQPNFTVLYPSDAVSAWRAVQLAIKVDGPVYIRTSRPKTPVVYSAEETFQPGQAKVLRESDKDAVTIVGGGVTLFEALEAHEKLLKDGVASRVIDLFSVQPIDRRTLNDSASKTGGRVIVVEDHYSHGGMGDAVASALAGETARLVKLAVREIPRSGDSKQLMQRYGISANHIVDAARTLADI